MSDVPPPRRARRTPGRKPRQPKIKKDEQAAITKEAKALAKEVNGKLDKMKKEVTSKKYSPEQRRRANIRRSKQRQKARAKNGEPVPVCKGFRWDGKPCQLPPLIQENWDGPNEVTGLYCVHHEPNITRDETEAFLMHGDPNVPLPRKVTPGELAHVLVQRSPHAVLEPYLKALGLEISEEGELEKTKKGLRLFGYSRGGEVVRSAYEDLTGQVQVAEKLFDRVYGKPRQSVDLASQTTTTLIKVDMTVQRVETVVSVLAQAGALPNGNGNGHLELDEAVDAEVVEEEL